MVRTAPSVSDNTSHFDHVSQLCFTPGTCPVLCSSNGEYEEGACRCYPGWKGAECSIRHNECEVPDCNNHGNCVAGECQCSRGYTGEFCQLGELSLFF